MGSVVTLEAALDCVDLVIDHVEGGVDVGSGSLADSAYWFEDLIEATLDDVLGL